MIYLALGLIFLVTPLGPDTVERTDDTHLIEEAREETD